MRKHRPVTGLFTVPVTGRSFHRAKPVSEGAKLRSVHGGKGASEETGRSFHRAKPVSEGAKLRSVHGGKGVGAGEETGRSRKTIQRQKRNEGRFHG